MKKLLSLLLIVALTACGFQPLHSQSYREKQEADLSAISVVVDNSRRGQMLKAEIEHGVNPDYQAQEKLYRLNIRLSEREIYLFINPDGTSSRGDIEYRSTYVLTRKLDNKIMQSGKMNRVSSYNMSEQADYASYVSEEDARKRGILELAQDYRLRMANLLPRINPQGAE